MCNDNIVRERILYNLKLQSMDVDYLKYLKSCWFLDIGVLDYLTKCTTYKDKLEQLFPGVGMDIFSCSSNGVHINTVRQVFKSVAVTLNKSIYDLTLIDLCDYGFNSYVELRFNRNYCKVAECLFPNKNPEDFVFYREYKNILLFVADNIIRGLDFDRIYIRDFTVKFINKNKIGYEISRYFSSSKEFRDFLFDNKEELNIDRFGGITCLQSISS